MPQDFKKLTDRLRFAQPLFPATDFEQNWSRLGRIISSPSQLAAGINASIEDAQIRNVQFNLTQADAEKAIEVYNAVITDGRYIKAFASDPAGVATNLNLQLPPAAADAIKQAATLKGSQVLGRPGRPGEPFGAVEVVAVAVVVVIVGGIVLIVVVTRDKEIVIDESGKIKL